MDRKWRFRQKAECGHAVSQVHQCAHCAEELTIRSVVLPPFFFAALPIVISESTVLILVVTMDPAKHTPPPLPSVVWDRIVHHLRRPLPRPTGRNDRSEIRQGELAIMMRVCKVG